MLTTAYYFLQVVLCSGVMMGYYWLVLRNNRFHQYNRFYLLIIALLSWIVPLIKIRWSHPATTGNPQVIQFLSVVADGNSQIDETLTNKGFQWSWDTTATVLYVTVAGILLIGMLRAFFRLYRLLQKHSCKTVGDVYLILTQAKGTPFSFFRYIFWNEDIDIRSEAGKQILQHELTHVQQKHSADKIWIQVILIAGWFNPFFWLLKKEMNMIHEFIADKKAVHNGDTASLAQIILTAAYPRQQFALTNSFFFSPIKRRLQMLTNNKTPRFSYIRRLIVLPLLAIVVVLFAFRSREQRAHRTLSVASVVERMADAVSSQVSPDAPALETKLNLAGLRLDTVIIKEKGKEGEQKVVLSFKTTPLNKPLIILDGNKADNNILETLSPNLIESIDILKNESATALYGDEGKNGVVIIKTKQYSQEQNKNELERYRDTVSARVIPSTPTIPLQVIAKDPLGNPVRSRKVFVKDIIYQGTLTGTKVWEESHEVTTDNNGMYTIYIGSGTKSQTTSLSHLGKIDWANGPFFINIKMAVAPSKPADWWVPSDNYIDMGTTQMLSVPYALFAGAVSPPFLITDSLGNVKWTSPRPKWVTGKKIDPIPGRITRIGYPTDPAIADFKKRNPSVREVAWKNADTKMIIELKDGTEETYDLIKPESKKRAENKYGKLPIAPPPPPMTTEYPKRIVDVNLEDLDKKIPSENKVFTVVQVPAEFPGGTAAWVNYLERNLNRDIVKKNGGPPGMYTVVVSFIVDKTGNISNVSADNDPGYGTKEEAIRVIVKGPKWKPAEQNGLNVIYRHKQSISFFVADPKGQLKAVDVDLDRLAMSLNKKLAAAKQVQAKLDLDKYEPK